METETIFRCGKCKHYIQHYLLRVQDNEYKDKSYTFDSMGNGHCKIPRQKKRFILDKACELFEERD